MNVIHKQQPHKPESSGPSNLWVYCLLAAILQTTPALAFEEIFQNAVDYLSGPLGFVLGALGLGFSAVLYTFGGEQHMKKVMSAGIGSLLVMAAPKILATIQGFVR